MTVTTHPNLPDEPAGAHGHESESDSESTGTGNSPAVMVMESLPQCQCCGPPGPVSDSLSRAVIELGPGSRPALACQTLRDTQLLSLARHWHVPCHGANERETLSAAGGPPHR